MNLERSLLAMTVNINTNIKLNKAGLQMHRLKEEIEDAVSKEDRMSGYGVEAKHGG